ncbi:hypothetical protein [Thalassobius sp. Cn5-15]|uniref:hypothetical protein n=1 Tax=Thalassobius sp. Cn5-15 TaxID=2917763 RepID=UPI001EF22EC3|nr:hypothetical protein [Thalassobius sp. Cn5-15]MCG7494688.1 hypothetical protein [Thalassobius sp. Cn5-15]
MYQSKLEILLLGLPVEAVLAVGFIVIVILCFWSITRTQRVFPFQQLVVIWGLSVLSCFAGPYLIKAYAFARLTDADNLFMLPAAEVGPSYAVLAGAFQRWSDMQLAHLTGSIFVLSLLIVCVAYLSALVLRGLYRLIPAKEEV